MGLGLYFRLVNHLKQLNHTNQNLKPTVSKSLDGVSENA